jgi:hypothetical protein
MEDSSEHLRRAIDDELKSLEKSARALKLRRNALAPIACLPPETIAIIFSFLSLPRDYVRMLTGYEEDSLAWLRVSHVCHRWREIALNHPRFWSHVDFNTLTLAGVTEVLSRSKMAPLELEANLSCVHWEHARIATFREQLVAHVSHTSRLSITAKSDDLQPTVNQLVSPAPSLEWLSLIVDDRDLQRLGMPARASIPPNLFDSSAPRLSHLQLDHCDIDWKSPLLKGLRILDLHTLSPHTRPGLEEWLDAMGQMPKLEKLIVHFATPVAPTVETTIPESARVLTHPSLAQLHIAASASDCAFALAHLNLPALASLRIDVISELPGGRDVRALIPYFSRNAHGPQDVEPLQSMIICGGPSLTEIVLWTEPDADIEVRNPMTLISAILSARAIFTISGICWGFRTGAEIIDTTLAALPLGSLNSLTAQNSSHFPDTLWLGHAPRWPSLERVRLVDNPATTSFTEMLTKDAPRDGPLLPSLTKISLFNSFFTDDEYHLLDMLIGRVEQGVPLQTMDLRACATTTRVVRLFSEIVVDVRGPELLFLPTTRWPTLSNWNRDMALLFQGDLDEYDDGDVDSEVFSDEVWFHNDENEDDDEDEDEDGYEFDAVW